MIRKHQNLGPREVFGRPGSSAFDRLAANRDSRIRPDQILPREGGQYENQHRNQVRSSVDQESENRQARPQGLPLRLGIEKHEC